MLQPASSVPKFLFPEVPKGKNTCLCKKGSVGFLVFVIVVCGECGRLLVANGNLKSRRCPYCGFRVWLSKAKLVASVETAREACELVQRLKRTDR